mmetsp:Transcript_23355/g.51316  ORF Transcript_23355/g.51316 Transcript_23355/m.51316 type:complete len:272 (+) Transcript_23355:66-881(+)
MKAVASFGNRRLGTSLWRAHIHLATGPLVLPNRPRFVNVRHCSADSQADELQYLAARLIEDRSLAERLAKSGGTSELLAAAAAARSASSGTQEGGSSSSSSSSANSSKGTDSFRDRLLGEAPLPTRRQMNIYFLQHFVPFIGFGFFDNFIMILAGDYIDSKLGIALGISTMAAAAIGNTISDIIGLWISGGIETAGVVMGLPRSGLTSQQRGDLRMRILKNTAMVTGMVLGCCLGMAPLAYPQEWRLWPSREMLQEELEKEESGAALASDI